jgi:hypothetical protein
MRNDSFNELASILPCLDILLLRTKITEPSFTIYPCFHPIILSVKGYKIIISILLLPKKPYQ